MLQRLFPVRRTPHLIGGLLPTFSLVLSMALSLTVAPGCSAPERDILHGIPISTVGVEGEAAAPVGLDPASTLAVEVLGPGGQPIPGAQVFALHAVALDPTALVLSSRVTGDRTRTLARRATWRGQTGADGQVSIPMAGEGGCLVSIEADELYGEAEYRGAGGDRLRVGLQGRRAVAVRVLEADGQPAEGVALTVRAEDAKGVLQALPITAVTGPDGNAELFVPLGNADGLEVMARLAMVDPPRVGIAGDSEAVLRLPPMGSVEIGVDGHPTFESAAAGLVQVFAASDGSRSRTTLAVPIVNGRAVVPRVQAGIALRAICAVADGSKPSEILASQSIPIAAVAAGQVGQARMSFASYERVGRKLEPR